MACMGCELRWSGKQEKRLVELQNLLDPLHDICQFDVQPYKKQNKKSSNRKYLPRNYDAQKANRKSRRMGSPAPSTVYIKIENIPYETFKIRLNQGLVTTELDQIRYRLERHIYCCGVCSKYVNGYCVVTNRKAEPEWICKSFVPKEEFIHLDARPGTESSASYRYLSETGLRKDVKGEDKKVRNEDKEEGSSGSHRCRGSL